MEVLKLNCDIVIPHVAVAEYNLEHGDYWDRDNSDIVDLVRHLSFQAIGQAFETAGCVEIDANFFVRDRAERFAVYATATLLKNIAEEVKKDHKLPSRMSAVKLVGFLAPGPISTYKVPWAEDQERSIRLQLWAEDQERNLQPQPPSIADLLSEVYRHWSGEAPPSRDWNVLRFNVVLEGSLLGLNLVILKRCHEIEIG